ncbi:hypothetical protein SCLCIDRAFT_1223928 [Scleroderma citrinum Foug A]|uniref:Uncharacterized protein n=1 Tax=Scleroderma citrinum Foug A TaxID=1036808 RepID=A0A0C3D812_9AGAM|nr:hypothetical protein SCLCIDRAFT_1223928 [Scleroderma citrinum Foug A]
MDVQSYAERERLRARLACGKWGNPLRFADKKLFPYPHSPSPIPHTIQLHWVACLHHPALALCSSLSSFGYGVRCVCPLPLYVIDGGYLHGPRRAA